MGFCVYVTAADDAGCVREGGFPSAHCVCPMQEPSNPGPLELVDKILKSIDVRFFSESEEYLYTLYAVTVRPVSSRGPEEKKMSLEPPFSIFMTLRDEVGED